MTTTIEQTPGEFIDWTIDWSARGIGTDTISTSAWVASSADFSLSNASIDSTRTMTTIFLTGGIPGKTYTITNNITTLSGRILSESVPYICIAQRSTL